MPTNIKCLGKVWTIFLWITRELINRVRLSVWELEYFLSVENIEISLYAQARQSLLLLTQGNIYNLLTFLNKYLMFLEELNELFRENWWKFLTAGYLVFWKRFPAAGYLKHVEKLMELLIRGGAGETGRFDTQTA